MADSAVVITAGTGTNIDTRTESTNGHHRQVVVLGDPATNAGVAPVDATAGLKVDLGADNDVTVTGSVTANIGTVGTLATAAKQDTGNTSLSTIAGAVSGTEMQVDVLTMPTVTVNSHAVTNAGTFAVQVDGAALTSLQLADDVVATLGTTTYTETTTKGTVVGAVRRDADTTLVDTTNEIGPLQMNAAGQLKVEVFSGETLPVSMTSTTVTGTVAVTQSGTWDEVGINDSGNSITVDNGGTFAVQNTNQTGDNTIGRVKLTDGTDVADVLDLTNSNPLTVAIVDSSGDQITSFGGGTQYTEDAAAAANPTGTMAMAVRADSLAGVTSTDGDNIALRATDKGEMYVKHTDTVNSELQTGDNVVGRVKLTDGDGNIADIFGLGSSSPLAVALVDADGIQVTSFGGGTQYTEGDTDATITGTAMMWEDTGDTLRAVSASKPLPVILKANDGVDVGDVTITNSSLNVVNSSPSSLAAVVYGYAQHDASLSGVGPLATGAYASAAAPTAVSADGDNVFLWADRNGRLQVGDGGQTLSIDDGSGAITVDNAGTFAVQVDGSALTSLQLIDDPVATTASAIPSKGMAVSGTDGTNARIIKTDTSGELQVDVLTMPTVTVNSHAVTNAGTFAVQVDGNALTSLQLIDDVVFTDDAAFTPATSKVAMIGAEVDDTGTDSVDEGDAGAVRMSANRNLYVRIRDNAGNERGLNIDANGALAATVTNATASNLNMTEASAASILTSVQLIDDGVYTDDTSTHSTGSSKGYGIMAAATPTDASVNANDIGMVAMTTDRKLHVSVQDALPAGTNAIGKLAANSGVDIGDVDITSIAAGTNNIGQVCVAPQTANGLSVFNATSSDGATALTSTAQAIKASAGQVYGWYIYNPNSSAQFVQFYNTAAASVTVGTTNPLFMLTIPATSAANVEFTNGITFSNAGFSCAATATAGGNGAPSTALDAVIFYK